MSLTGRTLQIIQTYYFTTEENSFRLVEQFISKFGRDRSHTYSLPIKYEWSGKSLFEKWTNFNNLLQEEGYFKHHPSEQKTVIDYCKVGFGNFKIGIRVLDYVRYKLGNDSSIYADFKDCVDTFLGDEDKYKNKKQCILNPEKNPAILEQFRDIPDLLVNQVVNKQKKELGPKKTSKGKRIPILCGWCGQHHPSYSCPDKKSTKWLNHRCTNCLGVGHPKAVCSSVNLSKEIY